MPDFFARLADHLSTKAASLDTDLTGMLQMYAERSGWPLEAARSVYVEYQDSPTRAYAIKCFRAEGDIDVVRAHEYGFNGQEPNPVIRRMATRMQKSADFLLAHRMSGGSP